MASYRFLVQQPTGGFKGCEFYHILRAGNEATDTLAKMGSTRQSIPAGVSLEHLHKPSITPSPESESIFIPRTVCSHSTACPTGTPAAVPQPTPFDGPGAAAPLQGSLPPDSGAAAVRQPSAAPNPEDPIAVAVLTVATTPSWGQPILDFLEGGTLPTDEVEAERIQRHAGAYTIINNELVKRSVSGVFQRCVEAEKGYEILLDIHQGECGHNVASRSLVAKAFRHGFYWTTALKEAKTLVNKCNGCQRFKARNHQSAATLQTILLTWPFAVWGLDCKIRSAMAPPPPGPADTSDRPI
ncbi:uncharacterized protein LOC123397623 [Hordeum vulgare subsp. vulgare]|uniref:uncharacterized protein LOC123397623 n=1 Tax=Hordeum vulgare subsp. vulgare TaxID=112509 RepID=UPI001D1A5467|nr:uncharacterized protein LOC123397623 [Hordeum vulgare subsp. vulgare]